VGKNDWSNLKERKEVSSCVATDVGCAVREYKKICL
jgi:hypothetical protein